MDKKINKALIGAGILTGLVILLWPKKSQGSAGGGGGGNTASLTVTPEDSNGNSLQASVAVDNHVIGNGAMTTIVSVGSHTITVAFTGYVTKQVVLNVPASGLSTIVVLSVTPPSQQGTLTIIPQDVNGTPLQAQVYIDGEFAGVGSVSGQQTVGQHTITATLAGYNNALQYVNVTVTGETVPLTMTAVGAPPPVGNAFTVSDEAASSSISPGAPAFNAVGYTATVTNNTSQRATHTLNVVYRYVDSSGNITQLFRLNFGETITLDPGGTYSFAMPAQIAGTPGPMDYIDVGVGVNACIYLVDENGNISSGTCTSGITPPPPGTIPPPNTIFLFKRYDMVIDRGYGQFWIINEGTDPNTGDFYTFRPFAEMSTGDPSQDFTVSKASAEANYSIWMHWGFNLVLTQVYHMIGIIPNPASPGIDLAKLSQLQLELPVDMTPNDVNNFFAPLYARGTILDLLFFQITQNGVIV